MQANARIAGVRIRRQDRLGARSQAVVRANIRRRRNSPTEQKYFSASVGSSPYPTNDTKLTFDGKCDIINSRINIVKSQFASEVRQVELY